MQNSQLQNVKQVNVSQDAKKIELQEIVEPILIKYPNIVKARNLYNDIFIFMHDSKTNKNTVFDITIRDLLNNELLTNNLKEYMTIVNNEEFIINLVMFFKAIKESAESVGNKKYNYREIDHSQMFNYYFYERIESYIRNDEKTLYNKMFSFLLITDKNITLFTDTLFPLTENLLPQSGGRSKYTISKEDSKIKTTSGLRSVYKGPNKQKYVKLGGEFVNIKKIKNM